MIRARKIAADLLVRWRRTVPTLIGMSFALAGLGAALTADFMLERDLDANFRNTNPAKIPAGYQDSVAEYYRKLSSANH